MIIDKFIHVEMIRKYLEFQIYFYDELKRYKKIILYCN